MIRTSQSQRFFRLAVFAVLFSFLLLILGAWGRVTEAGLGCPEWPGCYGRLFAPLTARDFNEARQYFPRQTPEEERALKETLHRYFSGALGLLIIRLAWLGWQLKKRVRKQQVLIPALVAVLVFAQVVLGILTIKLQNKPLVTMLHISAGLTIFGLLWWVVLREQRFWKPVAAAPAVLKSLRPRAMLGLILVIGQLILGAWVTANYAALACPDFPACQASYWPEMDVLNGFTLWRDIGIDYEGVQLDLPATTAIHMSHRVGAGILLLYIGILSVRTIRLGARDRLCRFGMLVLFVLLAQVTLGIISVLTHLPTALVVVHSAFGALLLLSLITLNHAVRPRA